MSCGKLMMVMVVTYACYIVESSNKYCSLSPFSFVNVSTLCDAADSDVRAAGGMCCLCGGAKESGGLELWGAAEMDPWVLVPPELKALPDKLLPRLSDLRRRRQPGAAAVVDTTPAEGALRIAE